MDELTFFAEIIKAIAWPILAWIALTKFKEPIKDLLSRINGFKAGSVELQLKEQLKLDNLSKENLLLINSLSIDELEIFMLMSICESLGMQYQTHGLEASTLKKHMEKLEKVGLIEIINKDDSGTGIFHKMTKFGLRLQMLLSESALNLLRKTTS